ncbi:protein phosphatase 1 regulatory subunit 12B isoform X1 [Dendroctonus ponderosae]|uniref:protein phosphatase 1 regulatory subunit 12B isoform X1 n=1 Tax=Dendroctonus ponderosae TaxID=77166 RepID=UPI002035901B|nr:protein phosphatase 1 regulatory subunit 12B isoform X1 [Dendroctonus ponderosae]XP_048525798.1 protein phosphatase 1 regulatory subunit 12B isoform X1 [Dendroctonus ponderosae]
MSLETRSNSALFKRAEQLKRWEESDTNREPVSPKIKSRRVKFSSGCVFLAACAAGDKEEVLKLLEKGADINTANVDGLTALHQACIDDNLDMVEFLVEQGADVNRGDNEGWTPLHATASCGFKYIAKYLIEKGADVAAVNNDGELALDIAECQRMTDLLRDEIRKRGIDCDAARNDEEIAMLRDAKEWLATKSSLVNEPHPKTGASALHVAAAKGYVNVMQVLLQCGADIDAQDTDGWSPIHAAAHWGQEEACRLLVEHLADLDAKNYVGQTAFDLADNSMLTLLTNLKEKQDKEEVNNRKAKKRAETQDRSIEPDSLTQVKKVKVEITGGPQEISKSNDIEMENESESESEVETSESESEESSSEEEEKKNKANAQNINDKVTIKEPEVNKPPLPPKTIENSEEKMPWRQQITKPKSDLNSPEKSNVVFDDYKPSNLNNENEVTLRRTKSFQNDELFYTKYKALHARIQANNDTAVIIPSARPKSDIILTNSTESHYRSNEVSTSTANTNISASPTTTTSPQAQNNQSAFRSGLRLSLNQPASATNGSAPAAATTPTSTVTTPTTPGGTRFQIFKNFFKSFVPPVRDEESETQRKAHAKRVRETRRSTQGVTLEEIKSAEQLVKLKNQPNNSDTSGQAGDNSNSGLNVSVTIAPPRPEPAPSSVSETTNGSATESHIAPVESHERRPSWRLKVDGGSKFKLEDATKPEAPNTPSFIRRLNSSTNSSRPSSAPIETAETTVTIPLRRPKSLEEKEQDKENDVRNAQATLATQAAIQRRRRPKRRSTGVVSFDNVEDMDQEKDPAAGGDAPEATKLSHESGSERSSRSRVSSTVDIRNENGEIDYKKLYEEQLVENDRLKDKLRKSDEELKETKQTLERINVVTSKNSLSELEKRERRAMERKLSEMEEELKQLQKLKAENERLKVDNRSLTRVINKLTNSAKK